MKWVHRKPKFKYTESDSPIDKISKIRGITDIDTFLSPNKESLHNPRLMKNIDKAGGRIVEAIKNNEKVAVSYDSDVDGITSGTIMVRYLSNYLTNEDSVRIIYGQRGWGTGIEVQLTKSNDEDRNEIVEKNIEILKDIDLLIIVDSSSNDYEMCKKIKESLGVDIIILDHHIVERNYKDNPAILVNPQQTGCEYPNKHLSGAGVVFKTIQVVEELLGADGIVDVWQYIDLVAVGLYADVMRVDVLENRYLILNGLRNVKNTGLVRILKGGKADFYRLNSDDIGFIIAPIINGVTRLNEIELAIQILLEDDDDVCKKLRLKMHKLNEKRKDVQSKLAKEYSKFIDKEQKVLFIADEMSSKGFNGLVAQQLATEYNRPAIVGRLHNGVFSGSFRSYGGFKLKSFLNDFDGELQALGHEGAGGIIIDEEYIANLMQYIDVFLPELDEIEPVITYDLEIDVDNIHEYIEPIEKYNTLTGNGFPKIVVKVNNIMIEDRQVIGKNLNTVKFKTTEKLELIKFRVDSEYADDVMIFDEINAVGVLVNNVWFNFKERKQIITPQIILDDYKKNG